MVTRRVYRPVFAAFLERWHDVKADALVADPEHLPVPDAQLLDLDHPLSLGQTMTRIGVTS